MRLVLNMTETSPSFPTLIYRQAQSRHMPVFKAARVWQSLNSTLNKHYQAFTMKKPVASVLHT